ncbi:TPA: hypothetical protein HA265_01730 [Candidatus Woesearchaeota archaeon]|nr:hypothetical protein [Candidatus Woesearchaeota archaeon]
MIKDIGKKENKIVQEIAEIIALDIHIKKFMEYMEQLNKEYDIPAKTGGVLAAKDVNSPLLNQSMHALSDWWFKVNKVLDSLSKATHKAVEMDRRAARELQKMFISESRQKTKEKRLEAVRGGLLALSKIAMNIIPGGGLLQAILDAKDIARLTKESLKSLDEAQQD